MLLNPCTIAGLKGRKGGRCATSRTNGDMSARDAPQTVLRGYVRTSARNYITSLGQSRRTLEQAVKKNSQHLLMLPQPMATRGTLRHCCYTTVGQPDERWGRRYQYGNVRGASSPFLDCTAGRSSKQGQPSRENTASEQQAPLQLHFCCSVVVVRICVVQSLFAVPAAASDLVGWRPTER